MMHLNDAIKRFKTFLSTVSFPKDPELMTWDPNGGEYLFTRGELTVIFAGADRDEFAACLNDIYAAVAPKELMSRGAAENLAIDAAAKIFEVHDKKGTPEFDLVVETAIRELKSALQTKARSWEVIHIVGGVSKEALPVGIGNIQFVLGDNGTLCNLHPHMMDRPIRRITEDVLRNNVLARIPVFAVDADAADAAAIKMLRRTLDCINFFGDRKRTGTRTYLVGEQSSGLAASVRIPEGNFRHAHYSGFHYGPGIPLPLFKVLKQPGFQKVSEMLANLNRNSLEERILTAFQWAGRAQVEPRPEESFLLLAIALESLLLGKVNEGNLGFRLGLRCAHLVGAPDLESRRLILSNIERLYGLRSGIVHSGNIDVPESDLQLIGRYARTTLYRLLNEQPFSAMTSEKQLSEWFQSRLLEVTTPA
jgi:hypothetical protein